MSSPIDPHVDLYGYLGMTRNPDGSITRKPEFFPTVPPSYKPDPNPFPVLTKDIPINLEKKTWARLYLPETEFNSAPTKKLPLIIYYHGGGFIQGSAASLVFQNFCFKIANKIPALIMSMDYRLAPEHRLPAAYDDGMEALHRIKTTKDEWLNDYADLSKCFLMGSSAGGNIVYHVGLRAVMCVDDLAPLKIQGLIFHHPFFGGTQWTLSELRLSNDKVLPPLVADVLWDLSLPVGIDRDHEYCNPMMGIKSEVLMKVKDQGWRLLVTGCDGDPLVDRQIEFVRMLKEKGLDAIDEFSEGGFHGCESVDDSKAEILYSVVKNFVLSM
ncbi:hypothetical protein RD792_005288 [Penstemon davidsonii]|uniref:Alpha/beta hydrolase fold-3 domain-containing protein n=1 Tax=Penstemon davidsonii TaxID=160366 RepID=A0ABR0DK88_9LAMI|nr:hypothetical protein RD792_005288 [Penstemon davidsonii]